jgi:hypothetical protein
VGPVRPLITTKCHVTPRLQFARLCVPGNVSISELLARWPRSYPPSLAALSATPAVNERPRHPASTRSGRPRGARDKLHGSPGGLLHVVSRGNAAFNNDGMRAVSLSLLLGCFYCIPPHLASTRRPVYADANLLFPLSRLPNRKKRIGNLWFCALATTRSTTLGSSYGAITSARNASTDVAHWYPRSLPN